MNSALANLLGRASTSNLAANGGNALLAGGQALKQLRSLVLREAETLTFADIFWVIMACFVVAAVLVPLLKNTPAPAAPSANAH
jgi:MFS transporter, DHA2 family, multidrug resistance protein